MALAVSSLAKMTTCEAYNYNWLEKLMALLSDIGLVKM